MHVEMEAKAQAAPRGLGHAGRKNGTIFFIARRKSIFTLKAHPIMGEGQGANVVQAPVCLPRIMRNRHALGAVGGF